MGVVTVSHMVFPFSHGPKPRSVWHAVAVTRWCSVWHLSGERAVGGCSRLLLASAACSLVVNAMLVLVDQQSNYWRPCSAWAAALCSTAAGARTVRGANFWSCFVDRKLSWCSVLLAAPAVVVLFSSAFV